jgi:hypothetical protein
MEFFDDDGDDDDDDKGQAEVPGQAPGEFVADLVRSNVLVAQTGLDDMGHFVQGCEDVGSNGCLSSKLFFSVVRRNVSSQARVTTDMGHVPDLDFTDVAIALHDARSVPWCKGLGIRISYSLVCYLQSYSSELEVRDWTLDRQSGSPACWRWEGGHAHGGGVRQAARRGEEGGAVGGGRVGASPASSWHAVWLVTAAGGGWAKWAVGQWAPGLCHSRLSHRYRHLF